MSDEVPAMSIDLRRVIQRIDSLAGESNLEAAHMIAVRFLCTERRLCIEYFGCEFSWPSAAKR
jgi:hypothetical protein